jgi:hypothetical protein
MRHSAWWCQIPRTNDARPEVGKPCPSANLSRHLPNLLDAFSRWPSKPDATPSCLPSWKFRTNIGHAHPHPPTLPRTARLLAHLLRRCSRRDDRAARWKPFDTDPWEWNCGFYPGSHPRECTNDTAATFDQARADFERAWAVFLSRRTEADFQNWRDDRDWHARKYAMWVAGEKLPSQKPTSLMRCPCGETFDSHRLEHTMVHVPHITKAQSVQQIHR